MSEPRNTIAVRRGLRDILALVEGDIEADRAADESRFTPAENRDIDKAIAWLRHQAYRATTEPSGGEG